MKYKINMRNMKLKLLIKLTVTLVFLISSIFTIAKAQINPVYKIMKQRGWTPLSVNEKTKLTHEQTDKAFLNSMGYNETIVSNLKKIGIDFKILHWMYGHLNDKIYAAISDCIVIGTVERKEYPLKEKAWFHTIAYVQIEEFLRNDYNISASQIPIMIRLDLFLLEARL